MGKKKRHALARQTIPREQKLDPDSSDEGSGGAPDTVLKLDDDDHSTVSSGAGETYTYSQREEPVAVDIQDGERIDRVVERMRRTETVSGWNRGRALKEVGVEIPKDERLYAKEFTPVADPWRGSEDTAEDQPWTKPIPLPLVPRTNSGSSISSPTGGARGQQNLTSTSRISTTPSNVKINAPKIRGAPEAVTATPPRIASGGPKALGDRTNSGSYAAAVSSNLITAQKPRTLDDEHRATHLSSANTTGVTTLTEAAPSSLAQAIFTPHGKVTSAASTLRELAKACGEDHVATLPQDEGLLQITSSNSTIAAAGTRNNPSGIPSDASTLAELAKTSAPAQLSSPVLDTVNGKSRKLSGAAARFKPGGSGDSVNYHTEVVDSARRVLTEGDFRIQKGDPDAAVGGGTVELSKEDPTLPVLTEDNLDAPGHLVDRVIKPSEPHRAAIVLQGADNDHPPAKSIPSKPGQLPTGNHDPSNPPTSESSHSPNLSTSTTTKPQHPVTSKKIMHHHPCTIPTPGLGNTPIIYTATTTTTATGAKVIEVDDFEYDYLYPIFTVEVRVSHTVVWYHPHGAEHAVGGLEEYLDEVFKMAEISLFVDYKCDAMGRKVRADVFWPRTDNWVSREVREMEAMRV